MSPLPHPCTLSMQAGKVGPFGIAEALARKCPSVRLDAKRIKLLYTTLTRDITFWLPPASWGVSTLSISTCSQDLGWVWVGGVGEGRGGGGFTWSGAANRRATFCRATTVVL
jgi:hypothetical protein